MRISRSVLFVVLGVTVIVYGATERRFEQRLDLPETSVRIIDDERSRAHGGHIVRNVAQCTTCHGEELAGREMADDWWLGRLDAPNLTPGRGGIASRTDAQLERSIRHGVGADGRPALMMPSHTLQVLSDDDVGSIIAYLRSIPPIDREARPRWVGPFTRLVVFVDAAPDFLPAEIIDHARVGRVVEAGPTPEYGEYLVEIGACRVCHRADLGGGLHPLSLPGEPPPPSLAAGGALARWSEEQFLTTMRTGRTPDGRVLDERFMPWRVTARMHDHELRAIWRYLDSLENAQHAQRARHDGRAS